MSFQTGQPITASSKNRFGAKEQKSEPKNFDDLLEEALEASFLASNPVGIDMIAPEREFRPIRNEMDGKGRCQLSIKCTFCIELILEHGSDPMRTRSIAYERLSLLKKLLGVGIGRPGMAIRNSLPDE